MTNSHDATTTRRRFLLATATVGTLGASGCLDRLPFSDDPDPPPFGPVEHGWRMIDRDAAATASNPGATAPGTDEEQLWKIDVGASPGIVIDGENLVVTASDVAYSFTLSDNELAWSDSVSMNLVSPAINDGRLLVGTGEREITCLDATSGDHIWTLETALDVRSPIVIDDTVLVNTADYLIAVDLETGNEQWRFFSEARIESAKRIAIGNDSVYLGRANSLISLNVNTGEHRWKRDELKGSPTVIDGTVYTTSDHLSAISSTGEILWRREWDSGAFSRPTKVGNLLCVTGDGTLLGLATSDGSIQWEERSFDWGDRPIADGDVLFSGENYPSRRILTANPQSRAHHTFAFFDDVPAGTHPRALADDILFIGNQNGTLWAYSDQ